MASGRVPGGPAEAAVPVSLPSLRFDRTELPHLVAEVRHTARDIETSVRAVLEHEGG